MEEKILIHSKKYNIKILFLMLAILGLLFSTILFISMCVEASEYDQQCYATYTLHQHREQCTTIKCDACEHMEKYPTYTSYVSSLMFSSPAYLIPLVLFILLGGWIYLWSISYALTVTNCRVYGTILWGIVRVDLPVDSITATAKISALKSVCITTASGKILFCFLKNANEIYDVISSLLIERQTHRKEMSV